MLSPPENRSQFKSNLMKNFSDSVILFANLLILFLLFLKFAAKPLIDLFTGRKKKQSEEFENLETQKEKLLSEIKDINKTLNEKQSLLENAGKNMIKQAEKKKSEIIKEAEYESDLILNMAKRKTNDRILHETQKLYAEIRSEILPNNMVETSGNASANRSDEIDENND